MTAAFSNVRALSLLQLLDLLCLSVAIGHHRDAAPVVACPAGERRTDVRPPPPPEAIAMLDDMRLHD